MVIGVVYAFFGEVRIIRVDFGFREVRICGMWGWMVGDLEISVEIGFFGNLVIEFGVVIYGMITEI